MHFYPKAFFRTVIKIYEHCAFRLRKGPIFNAVSTILGNLQRFTRFYFSEIRTAFLVVFQKVSLVLKGFKRFQKVQKKVSKYSKGSKSYERFQKVAKGSKRIQKDPKGSKRY